MQVLPITRNAVEQERSSFAPATALTANEPTTCCIVGGGPAGAVLSLLLARQGIPITLLEAHKDFERDFRGDTIHPSVLEIMDDLGLADRLLELPHAKIRTISLQTPAGRLQIADFGRLRTRYPFVCMMPQARFLDFITSEARRYSSFRLVMGANVNELIMDTGVVRGVRYHRGRQGLCEVRALLTVAADGRFSRLRKLAGFEPVKTSPPIDVLWFRLPRCPDDPQDSGEAFVGRGHFLILLDRSEEWQVAWVIPKDGFQELRAAGLETLRQTIVEAVPHFADRVQHLRDWKQVSLLSVESNRLPQWYGPGLLLIGDAAHVMSPVAGVGINYAIQDAVVAANVLAGPLKAGEARLEDLAAVQRQREWPTRIIQAFQSAAQDQIVARVLDQDTPFKIPIILRLILRVPLLRDLPARLLGLGIRRVHVRNDSKG